MHIVITGATGNVGTSVIESVATDPDITSVLGLARRIPTGKPLRRPGRRPMSPRTTWSRTYAAPTR
jgi:uncharacterized protein YbjT (DUF2867 family)